MKKIYERPALQKREPLAAVTAEPKKKTSEVTRTES